MKKQTKISAVVKVNKTMRDYSKEDFFVKKAEKAKAFLEKYGLPKQFIISK